MSALSGGQDLSNVQGDNQQSMLNKMAIDFILDSSSDGLKIPNDYAAHLCGQGCRAEKKESCKCALSHWTLRHLEKLSSNNKKQIDFYEKLVKNVLASASGKTSVGANDELPCESKFLYLANLSKDSNKIVQDLKSEIQKANCRSAQIVQHQKERNEAELEAKKKPLKFMASGTMPEVYDIPESISGLLIKALKAEFYEQEVERLITNRVPHIDGSWEDSVHDEAELGDDEESERGESDSQDGTEYVEGDEDDPSQVDGELFEDHEYGNDDHDSDACDTEDSEEEEEESDEDDDDYDDVD